MYALVKRLGLLFFIISLFFISAGAQSSPTSGDIYLGLRKLNVLGSVLYVAAHPDDENTRLLTYFSKDKLYRTGYLSLTRGDGGQNLIGDEQGIELGLIRTQELLAARRIDGAEQFFSRAFDFGFSKTPDETFAKWDREKVLADAVWVIRQFQPDVIITRFPTTGEGGHGHHTASAIIAGEAFTAAADPARFPEQLKWVQPWQAKRILWNTFNFGSNNTQRDDQFHFDVGGYNPVLGKSYGEIAADSRSQHKSQGFGVPRSRGEALEYFRPVAVAPVATDLFDEVKTDWSRVGGSEAAAQQIAALIGTYDFLQPQKSVPGLVGVYKTLKAMPPSYWRDRKMVEVKELIEAASGLWLEAFATTPYAVQGDSVRVNFVLNDRLGVPLRLTGVGVLGFDTVLQKEVAPNSNIALNKTLFIDTTVPLTQPYWLQEKMSEGYYTVQNQLSIGKPDVDPAFLAKFKAVIGGEEFSFERPIKYKFTDPVKGEIYQPLFVIPAATVSAGPDILLLPNGDKARHEAIVQLTANKPLNGSARIAFRGASQNRTTEDETFSLAAGSSKTYTFTVAPTNRSSQKDYVYGFGHMKDKGVERDAYLAMRSINYNHIPSIRYFLTDPVSLLNIDLQIRGKKIGYIVGAGDKVPQALEQMGFEVTLLGEKEMARMNLAVFDAIISGVRAYNTAEWLSPNHTKLMKYVEEGGNLIVQYNTSNNIGPIRAKIGPYPFTISRNRITDEGAAVTFLKPEHPALNYPNKITAADFSGWIQERSIYHAAEWGAAFEPIFRMADPGEKADDGSLIIAKHGKGFFTYTGLVFFRELPAGVPGAYRLIANLIALNQKKEI